MGSDGFEIVLTGTLGPTRKEAFFRCASGEEASGEEQRSGERRKIH